MTTSLSPSMLYIDLGNSLFLSPNQDGDCSVPGGRGVDQQFQVIRRSCGLPVEEQGGEDLCTLFPSVQSKVIKYKISRVSNEKPGLWVEVGLSSSPTSIGDKLQKFTVNLFPNKTTEIRLAPSLCSVTTSSLLVITVSWTHMTQAHERCKEGYRLRLMTCWKFCKNEVGLFFLRTVTPGSPLSPLAPLMPGPPWNTNQTYAVKTHIISANMCTYKKSNS